MMYRLSLILLTAVLLSGSAQAGAIAYDSFESHANGDLVVDTWLVGLTPDIGADWVKSWVQAQDTSTVTNEVAYSGTNSQKALRAKVGTATGVFTGIGTGMVIDVTKEYTFTSMYQAANGQYAADNCGTNFVSAGPSNNWIAGWNHFGYNSLGATTNDYFGIRNNATYVNVTSTTAFKPVAGNWYEMEMVVTIGANDGLGNYPITYDTFVTGPDGIRIQLADNFNGYQKLSAAGIAYGWELNTGAGAVSGSSTNTYNLAYYDDVTIIPEPMTVSLLGLGAIGLLRRFRK